MSVLSKTPNAPGSTASPVEETPGITVPVVHPRPSVARSGTEEPRVLTTLCNVAEAHKAADAAASLAALSASALVDPMLYQTPGPSQPSDAGKAKENSLSVSAYSMVAVTSTAPVSDRVSSTATTTLAVTATVPAAPVSVPLGNSANAALQDETVTGSTGNHSLFMI